MLCWEGIALFSTLFVLVVRDGRTLRRWPGRNEGRGGTRKKGKGKKTTSTGLTAAEKKALGRKSRKALVGIIVGLLALGVGGGVMSLKGEEPMSVQCYNEQYLHWTPFPVSIPCAECQTIFELRSYVKENIEGMYPHTTLGNICEIDGRGRILPPINDTRLISDLESKKLAYVIAVTVSMNETPLLESTGAFSANTSSRNIHYKTSRGHHGVTHRSYPPLPRQFFHRLINFNKMSLLPNATGILAPGRTLPSVAVDAAAPRLPPPPRCAPPHPVPRWRAAQARPHLHQGQRAARRAVGRARRALLPPRPHDGPAAQDVHSLAGPPGARQEQHGRRLSVRGHLAQQQAYGTDGPG